MRVRSCIPVLERSSLIGGFRCRGHLWGGRQARRVQLAGVSAKLAAVEAAIVALPLRQWPEGVLTKRTVMHVRAPSGPRTHVLARGSPYCARPGRHPRLLVEHAPPGSVVPTDGSRQALTLPS